jgi:murein DD-endopeptidase MepM/ murein hydrolase activator NlpD
MKKIHAIYLTLILLIASSCSQKPAHVEFKGYTFYGKNYYEYNGNSKKHINRKNIRKSNKTYAKNYETGYTASRTTVEQNNVCQTNSGKEIIVKSGNTLYGIAIENDIPVKNLITLNNLEQPYTLKVGQKLKVSSEPSGPISHTVQSGDNLGRIAEKYNTKTVELAQLNNLHHPYSIKIGQKLNLPSNSSCIQTNSIKVVNNTPKTPIRAKPKSKSNKFTWPVEGRVISRFGPKEGNLYNDGINISASKGTSFRAAEDGVVAYVGNELKGYGNLIIIKHARNWVSAYAHSESVSIGRGESVKKGQIIGKVGTTGNVNSPQLYFGLRKGRKALDPQKYLR